MKDTEPNDCQLAFDFDEPPEFPAQSLAYRAGFTARTPLKLVYSRPTAPAIDDHTEKVIEATIAHARSLSW